MTQSLSFVHPTADSPWGTYLMQVDRVAPGSASRDGTPSWGGRAGATARVLHCKCARGSPV